MVCFYSFNIIYCLIIKMLFFALLVFFKNSVFKFNKQIIEMKFRFKNKKKKYYNFGNFLEIF